MTHPLTARLLRNRAAFYQELLRRIPSEKFRRELEHAVTGFPELKPPAGGVSRSISDASSAFLSALEFDEWLKKDDIGAVRARRVISIETALAEACHLERLGILLCDALEEGEKTDSSIRTAHKRAFIALFGLRDALEYHRITLLNRASSL